MYPLLFFVLLAVLFFLSHTLTKELFRFLYTVTRSKNLTIILFSLLFFPGVLIHELSHYLMALVLMVPVGKMEFFPQMQDGGLKLGSVSIAKTDPIRRFFIGVAPLMIGVSIILATLYFYQEFTIVNHLWKVVVLGYVLFEIGNTMYSSKKDLEGALELVLTVTIIGIILFISGVRLPAISADNQVLTQFYSIFEQGIRFLLFPIGIDIAVITVLRLFFRPIRA